MGFIVGYGIGTFVCLVLVLSVLLFSSLPHKPHLSIHLSNLVQVRRELFHHFVIARQFHPPPKAQEPVKKLVADFHTRGNSKMFIIHFCVLHVLCAESFNHRIKQSEKAVKCYKRKRTFIHREHALGVTLQVDGNHAAGLTMV